MIYKFKSQADGDVIMLESNGNQILAMIGRAPSAQGVVTVAQIPAAIADLEAALITHQAAELALAEQPATELTAPGDSGRLRALADPFIDLLRNSAKDGKDVVWGV